MRILFVHQNCPGQYEHLARYFLNQPDTEFAFLCQPQAKRAGDIPRIVYQPHRQPHASTHPYLSDIEAHILAGQAVAGKATELKNKGFMPDIMIGHNGWGETLFLKDVWPDSPLLSYFEFFYGTDGGEIGFDLEPGPSVDELSRKQTMNVTNLVGLEAADWGQTPTRWQHSRFPAAYRQKMTVVHDGINTRTIVPNDEAAFSLGRAAGEFTRADEIVTFVARNLEPVRGFHIFMRALPEMMARRPKARFIVVGGDGQGYGARPQERRTWRQILLAELKDKIDMDRVHFLGRLSYPVFIGLLQATTVHVYLSYPFVLSWSMIESMATGGVVVGSRTPPVQEVIKDGRNGYLFDFSDHAALAERVTYALEHRDQMQEVRKAARATIVREYDLVDVCLPRQLAVIDDLIAGRAPRRF